MASALTVVLAPACSRDPAPAAPDTARADVGALLDRWADAARRDDRAALAEVFGASSGGDALAAVDGRYTSARVLSGLPVTEYSIVLDRLDRTDAPPPGGADEARVAVATLRYAYDLDPAPTAEPLTVLVVRDGQRWSVAQSPAPGSPLTASWRAPWDYGPLRVARPSAVGAPDSIVLGHSGQETLVDDLDAELPGAVDAVDAVWGTDWARAATIVVTGSDDEFAHQVGPGYDPSVVAAAAVADAVVPGRPVTGQRIVFGRQAAARLDADDLRTVLRHELTHVATRATTVDDAPRWLLEGYADFVGRSGNGLTVAENAPALADLADRGALPTSLPADDDLLAGHAGAAAGYEFAWSLVAYLADRTSAATVTGFHRDLAGHASDPARLAAALEQWFGLDPDRLLVDWRHWFTTHLTVVPG